ncbi:MAG: ChbG/HpnK family deacetylase [Edaphobacter sp.]|nr:ChbG/HpnK family deacetylase [Edaphobacter sp.]MDE1178346.1 ChbG/HpnK family deacetylase [Edaphobacter sp.]
MLGPDRKTFRPSLIDFVQALLRGHIREEEIEHEVQAQIRKIRGAGISITHVDTHKHSHLFPRVARPLLHVLEQESITAIRNPFEPAFTQHLAHADFKRRMQIRLLNRLRPSFQHQRQIGCGIVSSTGGTIGVSATGNLNAITLTELLEALPAQGTYELVCHPGYNDSDLDRITTRLRTHREIEMQALITAIPAALARPNAPELIHFGAIAPAHV